jgi:hypothetical protein
VEPNNSHITVKTVSATDNSNIQVETLDDVKVESADAIVKCQEEGGGTPENKDWSKLKVQELKAELRAYNLTLSGRKANLISLLNSNDLECLKLEKSEAASSTPASQLSALELL